MVLCHLIIHIFLLYFEVIFLANYFSIKIFNSEKKNALNTGILKTLFKENNMT